MSIRIRRRLRRYAGGWSRCWLVSEGVGLILSMFIAAGQQRLTKASPESQKTRLFLSKKPLKERILKE